MYLHTGETVYRGWVSHARDALTISIGIWCTGQVRIYLIQDYTWCGRPGLYVEESLRVQYMIQGYIRMVYAWCTHGDVDRLVWKGLYRPELCTVGAHQWVWTIWGGLYDSALYIHHASMPMCAWDSLRAINGVQRTNWGAPCVPEIFVV